MGKSRWVEEIVAQSNCECVWIKGNEIRELSDGERERQLSRALQYWSSPIPPPTASASASPLLSLSPSPSLQVSSTSSRSSSLASDLSSQMRILVLDDLDSLCPSSGDSEGAVLAHLLIDHCDSLRSYPPPSSPTDSRSVKDEAHIHIEEHIARYSSTRDTLPLLCVISLTKDFAGVYDRVRHHPFYMKNTFLLENPKEAERRAFCFNMVGSMRSTLSHPERDSLWRKCVEMVIEGTAGYSVGDISQIFKEAVRISVRRRSSGGGDRRSTGGQSERSEGLQKSEGDMLMMMEGEGISVNDILAAATRVSPSSLQGEHGRVVRGGEEGIGRLERAEKEKDRADRAGEEEGVVACEGKLATGYDVHVHKVTRSGEERDEGDSVRYQQQQKETKHKTTEGGEDGDANHKYVDRGYCEEALVMKHVQDVFPAASDMGLICLDEEWFRIYSSFLSPLRNPAPFAALGVRPPTGCLLTGSPGTGMPFRNLLESCKKFDLTCGREYIYIDI